jgi:hypothetical protein
LYGERRVEWRQTKQELGLLRHLLDLPKETFEQFS